MGTKNKRILGDVFKYLVLAIILIFIIQLSLLPFGLPLGKFFFPFLGVEVFPNGG